jgi:ketosteroid isomerase-like protein
MRCNWLVFPALLLPLGCQPAPQASDPAADEAAIRAVLEGLEATWNAMDLDANAEFVDSDMVSLPPGEPPIIGEPANRQEWAEFLAANDDEWHPSLEQVWVSGDLAVAWGPTTSVGGPKGSEPTERSYKNVWAFRRGADGTWRLLLETWSPDSAN